VARHTRPWKRRLTDHHAARFTVIHRREESAPRHHAGSRAHNPRSSSLTNAVMTRFLGNYPSRRDGRAPARHAHRCDARVGLRRRVMAIGHNPTASCSRAHSTMDWVRGLPLTRQDRPRPAWAGVFACGDVADPVYPGSDNGPLALAAWRYRRRALPGAAVNPSQSRSNCALNNSLFGLVPDGSMNTPPQANSRVAPVRVCAGARPTPGLG